MSNSSNKTTRNGDVFIRKPAVDEKYIVENSHDTSDDSNTLNRVCKYANCRRRIRSKGLCKAHGGGRRCMVEGCDRSSQGQGLCIRHGGGKRCNNIGCTKASQSNGLCKAHGGGIRCQIAGCIKSSQGGGLCRAHGGGQRCDKQGCTKGAQRGGFCASHGGSRFCQYPECTKNDRGGGFCAEHGGGKRCDYHGCNKPARKKGKCSFHANTAPKATIKNETITKQPCQGHITPGPLSNFGNLRTATTSFQNGAYKNANIVRANQSHMVEGYSRDPYLHIQTDQQSYESMMMVDIRSANLGQYPGSVPSNSADRPAAQANCKYQLERSIGYPENLAQWPIKDQSALLAGAYPGDRQIYGYPRLKQSFDQRVPAPYATHFAGHFSMTESLQSLAATHSDSTAERHQLSHYDRPDESQYIHTSSVGMNLAPANTSDHPNHAVIYNAQLHGYAP
uniref:Uncharacterized protein AlNc14C65G4639 n=1 Tax=Albugo laibachii Nc14 TaxID=890382 RepID=F0WDB9_9STRA|nr:conserved hypothetical protein [Albugo laibachii Nc14]|eukprot:CCA19191.1 conserved hypothetical protein [Albugo laibachii Nc14]